MSVRRLCLAGILAAAVMSGALSKDRQSSSKRAFSSNVSPEAFLAPLSSAGSDIALRPTLVGVYSADGKFRRLSSPTQLLSIPQPSLRPSELPPSVQLRSVERIIEDFEPPTHAVKSAKGHSVLGTLRDSVAALAYGREKVLLAPTHVTTDSRHRLVLSDPDIPAVHVLDASGKDSFRIVGGSHHRLQTPNGIAVDAADNIYVADGRRGMILVYDPQGIFLRYIGNFNGEGMFGAPLALPSIAKRAIFSSSIPQPISSSCLTCMERCSKN